MNGTDMTGTLEAALWEIAAIEESVGSFMQLKRV
jgi:hypothetical protein